MKTWQVALAKEQGVEFAVVCVQDSVSIARQNAMKLSGGGLFNFNALPF